MDSRQYLNEIIMHQVVVSFLRRQESTFYFESDSGEIAQFQQ